MESKYAANTTMKSEVPEGLSKHCWLAGIIFRTESKCETIDSSFYTSVWVRGTIPGMESIEIPTDWVLLIEGCISSFSFYTSFGHGRREAIYQEKAQRT